MKVGEGTLTGWSPRAIKSSVLGSGNYFAAEAVFKLNVVFKRIQRSVLWKLF